MTLPVEVEVVEVVVVVVRYMEARAVEVEWSASSLRSEERRRADTSMACGRGAKANRRAPRRLTKSRRLG